jgi:hypothetical protein
MTSFTEIEAALLSLMRRLDPACEDGVNITMLCQKGAQSTGASETLVGRTASVLVHRRVLAQRDDRLYLLQKNLFVQERFVDRQPQAAFAVGDGGRRSR